MAERCNSCGAELFTGQQFCRACGTPTRRFSSEELPTQILPPGGQEQPPPPQQPAATPLATSPLDAGRHTSDPVFGAGYTSYQPPPAPPLHAPMPAPHARTRSGSRTWLYAVLGLLIFFGGASVVAGLFFMNQRAQRVVKTVVRPNVKVPMPPVPPPHPMNRGEEEGKAIAGEQSVITETYPLAQGGSFSLRNFSGDITVEGWDEQQAEVKIIKRGGGKTARAAFNVVHEEGANRLVFNSTPEKTGGGVQVVEYVVKLPRNLRELEIVSMKSNVELVDVHSASISINVQQGNIELEDVSGTVNSRTTKGNTTVALAEAAKGAPQIFNGIRGNIELELAPGTNAELKAETVDGEIDVDEDLHIKVEQRMIGQHAVGRLGTGGQPIVVKVVSGNIKIKS